jgi:hypothetical protein
MKSTKITLSKVALDTHNLGTELPIEQQMPFMGNKIKTHALSLSIENKNLKEQIRTFNLFKYLIVLFTKKYVIVPLYERICI